MAADANASLGVAEAPGDQVTEVHGSPHRNDAGIRLREFCNAQALCAPATFFTKGEHNTRKHMRNNSGYQIDHFLVQQEDRVRVRDAGVSRRFSPALHGDHAPVYMRYGMEKIAGREMARPARRRTMAGAPVLKRQALAGR